jgi:hypothetical protein
MRQLECSGESNTGRVRPSRRENVARLRARAGYLRGHIARIRAEYEAGHIPLDRELAHFREIERELREIGAQLGDLAFEEPKPTPEML